jgi:hypothetical protein
MWNRIVESARAAMVQMLSLGLTMKVVLVVLWIVFTIGVVLLVTHKGGDTASARIIIHLPEDLQKLNLQFGVLHVRDGKDEVLGTGDIVNEEIPFRSVDRQGTMEATITYTKRLGFQFKCFVDHRQYEYAQIERLLKEAGFLDPSEGGGKKFRIWFILEGYPTYTTIDGFMNNYYYPS